MGFATLQHNLLCGNGQPTYAWPSWFPRKTCGIKKFLKLYSRHLRRLRGQVTLIAGGPPCQGFSLAGRRRRGDHRNELYKVYLQVVRIVRPALVLMENVQGITVEHGKKERALGKVKRGRPPIPYAARILKGLQRLGYQVFGNQVKAVDHGVPQLRPRFFVIGIDKSASTSQVPPSPFDILRGLRATFLSSKGLPTGRPVSAKEAISDLERKESFEVDSPDSKGFKHGLYGPVGSPYQALMRSGGLKGTVPDSHRFVKHRESTVCQFERILSTCRRGVQLGRKERAELGIRKTCVVPLAPDKPSHTLTTLPDDLLHYKEPRILTVREYARLQSFPDWFEFRSKYTTGDVVRRRECPRYTQVGNAVPPLLAEAIGETLKEVLRSASTTSRIG